MKPPIYTLYMVQVFKSPHWVHVLSTYDKTLAKQTLKEIGKSGRIEEVKVRRK